MIRLPHWGFPRPRWGFLRWPLSRWPLGHTQLRVGHDRRTRMSWHVNFGNDGDVAIRRVRHYPTNVILRIKTAIKARMTGGGIDVGGGGRSRGDAPRADLREAGIFFDLQAPSLVIREMPMQHVQLVERHPVDESHDELRRLKVAHRVEHQSAPGEPWAVSDALRRNDDGAGSGTSGGGELPQCNGGIEESTGIAGGQQDLARCDLDRVTLRVRASHRLIEPERYGASG